MPPMARPRTVQNTASRVATGAPAARGSGPTINHLAPQLGVHKSTVSRAMDPARRNLIGAGLPARVEAAARELGCRPHRAAAALSTGRSRTGGVLLPDITDPVLPPILRDLLALIALQWLKAQGVDVPRQMSLTGHNDMPLLDQPSPPLSSVRIQHCEMGPRATRLLLDALRGDAGGASTVVPRPELIVRGSTGQAPG